MHKTKTTPNVYTKLYVDTIVYYYTKNMKNVDNYVDNSDFWLITMLITM